MSIHSGSFLLCGLCLYTSSFDLYLFFTPHFLSNLSLHYYVSASHFLTLVIMVFPALPLIFSSFNFHLHFPLIKTFTHPSLVSSPHPTVILPTSTFRPLTLLLGIILCFLAIHRLPFISHSSVPPRFLSFSFLSLHLCSPSIL